MPRGEDLHGNAPDKAAAALLLIELINDLEGEQLLRQAPPMARGILALKMRAKACGIPTIHGIRTGSRRRRYDPRKREVSLTLPFPVAT